LVAALQASLLAAPSRDPIRLQAELAQLQSLGLDVQVGPPAASREPWLSMDPQGRQWLESVSSFQPPGGRPLSLRLRQNVTASVQREWIGQLLLIAAAGVSSLFTSGLLRLVLRRGLVVPLAALDRQLTSLSAQSLGRRHLAVAEQPLELQPIATAFNQLQDRLAASWERERAFVDGVAHELRTPITLISGRAQSLRRQTAQEGPLSVTLEQIIAEARRMASLVSDLLELARQDSGRLALRLQPLDGDDALLQLYERLAPLAAVRLRLLGPQAAAAPLAIADPDRLQQCLTALVDNALRYSDGLIELSAVLDPSSPGWLVLHVRDHGPGVTDPEKAVIFQRFQRGAAAVNTRGSGIGLSVVQRLMEAMGGSVQVADAEGGGADFQLCLPLAAPLTPGSAPA
jgi:signal transduction histidine kinase